MAVAYSVVDKGFANNLIKFSNVSKEAQFVLDYIDDIYEFIDACNNKSKTLKQLLKQYNEIVAMSKKADKSLVSGKFNNTINQDLCSKFERAKKDLQKCRQTLD